MHCSDVTNQILFVVVAAVAAAAAAVAVVVADDDAVVDEQEGSLLGEATKVSSTLLFPPFSRSFFSL